MSTEDSDTTRIAVMESRIDNILDDLKDRRLEMDDTISDIKIQLSTISKEINRYKGIVGGIVFAFSIIWAGIVFFVDALKDWFHH